MTQADLPDVEVIGRTVHPNLPEDPQVFTERLELYPPGCLVWQDIGAIGGYAISHPWTLGQPPKLDTLLGILPAAPDTFYIHDLALLERARGSGIGTELVRRLAQQASNAGLATLSLIAVSGSAGFWQRHGFHAVVDEALAPKLRSYGADASFMVRQTG